MTERLMSVETGSSAQTIEKIMSVVFPDARTILDTTYGSGSFWRGSGRDVTGLDINPSRAKDVCADFTALPFSDGAFDVVVFDPPYHTDMGRGKASVMGAQFGTYPTLRELAAAVHQGAREASRVSRLGFIVKVQDYVHGQKFIAMTEWVRTSSGALPVYERVEQMRSHKIIDPKWGEQYSAYRNHATYLMFRHGSQYHRKRTGAPIIASGTVTRPFDSPVQPG